MAKRPRRTKRRPGKGTRDGGARDGQLRGRILDAALRLAAERGWRRTGLADIAAEAGIGLDRLRAKFASKPAIVNGLIRRTDERALALGAAEGSSARDRLFDMLMRRFDTMATDRAGIAAILRDLCRDPATALCHAPRLMVSMAWMLEAAGLSSSGPLGLLRTKGLAAVYLWALRAWLADDSRDLAKTMAALDRGLRQAEALAGLLNKGRDRTAKAAKTAAQKASKGGKRRHG
ncbi:MAG: TetR/AcrR family transcriptional regulator [Rhodospirillales bacterium]|nr:TetR/AcrR family transcriptional regulator [Rhodospirillales bacterium]